MSTATTASPAFPEHTHSSFPHRLGAWTKWNVKRGNKVYAYTTIGQYGEYGLFPHLGTDKYGMGYHLYFTDHTRRTDLQDPCKHQYLGFFETHTDGAKAAKKHAAKATFKSSIL